MTIEKHGNKWRIIEMYKGDRYRISLDYKPTTKEAMRLISAKIENGPKTPNDKMTFYKAAIAYIDSRSNVISPSTDKNYRSIVKNLSDNFKDKKLCDITAPDVQEEINQYSLNRSTKSVLNAHGFISSVIGAYMPTLTLHTKLPQKQPVEYYTPTDEDVKQVIDSVKGTQFEIAFRLACYSLRRGEICALTADDLDGNKIHVCKSKVVNINNEWVVKPVPKNDSSDRYIIIKDDLADLIRKNGVAFDGNPNTLNQHLKRVLKKLGLPMFRFHDFRAYFASTGHAHGILEAQLQKMGGWKSDYTFKRVYRRAQEDVYEAVNKEILNILPD